MNLILRDANFIRFSVRLFLLFIFSFPCFAINSPIGFWKTIDDVTGQPKAIIQISENQDKQLMGRILKIFPSPGHSQNEICSACKDDKHNRPIVGMIILEKLIQNEKNPSEWHQGRILDPKNGTTYHCTIQLVENGKALNVRGYFGLPLFGRTQTWVKFEDNQ